MMVRPVTSCRSRRRGFTLIEASLTCVIVGVGFVAMLQLLAAGTISNVKGIEGTTGTNLAKNIRELFLWNKTWANLSAMKGTTTTYSPPVDSRGNQLTSFSDWSQIVTIQVVDPNRLTLNLSNSTVSPTALRMTVNVTHHANQVCTLNWYVFQGGP
jgi:Tfp pilus assembly protein PilV